MNNNTCLIAIDDSEPSLKAVDYIIGDVATRSTVPKICLVNVQPALPSDVTRFIDAKTIADFHREAGEKALTQARQKLSDAGLAYSAHILIGETAPALVEFANAQGCDLIVMGVHGFGSVVGLFMGSVSVKVVRLASVPVLLIK